MGRSLFQGQLRVARCLIVFWTQEEECQVQGKAGPEQINRLLGSKGKGLACVSLWFLSELPEIAAIDLVERQFTKTGVNK